MRFNTKDSFNKWRMCRGLCTICGHPLDRFSNMKAFEDKKTVTEEQMEIEEPLEEETPVRQALFRYCMLGIMNQSHIIDKHTFLSVPMAETEFSKCQPFFHDQKLAHFVEQVRPSEFQEAYRRCIQYCLEHTTPACRECNLAMTKKRPQNLVAVRCCPHTSNTKWQDFEKNTTVLARMNQIALYFVFDGTKWVAKEPLQMLMDGYLWRCVVQLGLWCEKPSLFRHRAVAVLYLAYLVFNTAVAWQKQFEFLDWHIHVFRRFYMHKYKGNTFAGYTDVQLRAVFASPMANPLNWCVFVQKVQADVEQAQRVTQTLRQMPREVAALMPYRAVDVMALQPSQSLDALAQAHAGALPREVRRALAGLGAMRSGGPLASYLLFEPGFVGALVNLGEQDAYARKSELLAFLDGGRTVQTALVS